MLTLRQMALVGAGVVALGGCGTDTATNSASSAASPPNTTASTPNTAPAPAKVPAETSKGKLSPTAQMILDSAEGLAAEVVATANGFASRKLPRDQARQQFDGYQPRAQALAQQAQNLASDSPVAAKLTGLTDRLQATIKTLRSSADGGSSAAKDATKNLSKDARQTYKQLLGKLPADLRKRVENALKLPGGS